MENQGIESPPGDETITQRDAEDFGTSLNELRNPDREVQIHNELTAGSGTLPFEEDDVQQATLRNSMVCRKETGGLWTSLNTVDDIPPRAAHSADLIGDSHLVVFGGWNGTEALSDLHILDLHDLTWRKVDASGAVPSKRNNHASAVFAHRLYVHGGHDGTRWLTDFYCIDLSSQISTDDITSPTRSGRSDGEIDTTKPLWIQPAAHGKIPRPRACHTLSRVRRKLYMFGGYDGTHCFNDIEVLDLESFAWITATVKGCVPEVD
eukprot:Gregarina_sp_Poly_1__6420@NODE_3428_length_1103_cov_8_534749_g2171_i0_p1_GENE_NODE_3428_length_1103_cov_8_534749_g2171_i0NODE_3428_length_1103_cov_8_534749_g2171_i0_p1_ORF_typecomplete_len264_score33_77Kelch_3/PF13415_6/14Kelch_3/PF13415_6/1_8e12Kelch_3/PF13415_6/7e09Kelch_3/PF13415_6/1_2e06Kelch_4/PF13418_6/4_7e12Kelch_4/PF13418_6/0_001Kelch_4/PF13418_6/5_2e10Kelch_2/PF07646_15/7_6e10Kelch_2/PF07646_15/0_00011Kelch_2/PF07646_15/7_7e10Kelch_6/PF13964_6/4_2e11Kelch_6/PF13964_6/0_00027Kelch_6/PF13